MADKLSKQEKQQQKEQEKFERERRKWKYQNSKKKKKAGKLDFTEIIIKTLAVLVAAGLVLGVAGIYASNYSIPTRFFPAVTVGGKTVSTPEWAFYFYNQYSQNAGTSAQYGQLASYLGFVDVNKPVFGQEKGAAMGAAEEEGAEKTTWDQYLRETTNETLHNLLAAYQQAQKDGVKTSAANQKKIDEEFETLRKSASDIGMTISAYLRVNYTPGLTEKKYREMMERDYIVQAFEEKKKDEFRAKYTDAELKKLYDKDTTLFDFVDYYSYSFAKTTLTAAEGETTEVLAERQKQADAAPKAEAEAFLSGLTSGESFLVAATAAKQKEYQAAIDKAAADGTEIDKANYDISKYDATQTLTRHSRLSKLTETYAEENAKWFLSAKQGAVKVIETDSAFIAVFVARPAYQVPTREYYMIPVENADYSNDAAAAKAEADRIFEEWKAGEANLESFKTLADARISDETKEENSAVEPGRVEKAIPGYEAVMDNWLFDGGRKAGDAVALEMQQGSAVLYYVGENKGDYSWKVELTAQGVQQEYDTYTKQLLKDYPLTEKKMGVNAALKTCERLCELYRAYIVEQLAAQASQGEQGGGLGALLDGLDVEAEAGSEDHEGHDHE